MFEIKQSVRFLALLGLVIALMLLIAPMIDFADVSSAPSAGANEALSVMTDDGGEGGGNEGEGNDDEGDDESGPGRGNCEKGDKGEDKGKGEKKGHEKCDDDNVANPVTQAQLYLVAVACQFQNEANATTCLFVGGTERGIADVSRIAIPDDMACSEVTGGIFSTSEEDGLGQMLTSADGAQEVTLVMEGRVTTNGTASYRVTTPSGLFPATGPGLQCGELTNVPAPAGLSATAGAIRVIAYQCPDGVDPKSVDWFAACATAAPGVTFRLAKNGESSDTEKTGTTDDQGNLSFDNLESGTYHLTEDGGNWCHAESDSVDAQGDVIVTANERSTVWIFHCPEPAAS